MILRCDRSTKRPDCTGFVGAAPDGSLVLGTVQRAAEAHSRHFVLACLSCGTLYEVRPPWMPIPRRALRSLPARQ